MRKIRNSEEVTRIDEYIAEHYPEDGPDAVAKALGESRQYIQERAWKNHIRYTKKRPPRKRSKKDIEIERLRGEVRRLQISLVREKRRNKSEAVA